MITRKCCRSQSREVSFIRYYVCLPHTWTGLPRQAADEHFPRKERRFHQARRPAAGRWRKRKRTRGDCRQRVTSGYYFCNPLRSLPPSAAGVTTHQPTIEQHPSLLATRTRFDAPRRSKSFRDHENAQQYELRAPPWTGTSVSRILPFLFVNLSRSPINRSITHSILATFRSHTPTRRFHPPWIRATGNNTRDLSYSHEIDERNDLIQALTTSEWHYSSLKTWAWEADASRYLNTLGRFTE